MKVRCSVSCPRSASLLLRGAYPGQPANQSPDQYNTLRPLDGGFPSVQRIYRHIKWDHQTLSALLYLYYLALTFVFDVWSMLASEDVDRELPTGRSTSGLDYGQGSAERYRRSLKRKHSSQRFGVWREFQQV